MARAWHGPPQVPTRGGGTLARAERTRSSWPACAEVDTSRPMVHPHHPHVADLFLLADDLLLLAEDLFLPADDLFLSVEDLFLQAEDLFLLAEDLFLLAEDLSCLSMTFFLVGCMSSRRTAKRSEMKLAAFLFSIGKGVLSSD